MNRIRLLVVGIAVAMFASACTTPSLGRMQPYLGEHDGVCADIAKSMEYVNRFQANTTENSDYSKGAAVASTLLLGVNTQADERREMQAAWKSGIVRRIGLDAAWGEAQCEGQQPRYDGPPPCKSNLDTWAHTSAGYADLCIGFSRKERERYGID